ncbi:MAG TPA: U32 family peptidase [Roseiflexaceae bacterium]|nr:U32 family peptidase [Roseiflexaceae bacterium]
MTPITKPEVMAPAGYWPQLNAAVEAGADAVYFGLKHFTARAKVGFDLAELPEVMRTLHRRGVRGYITFNTLVFDHELGEAARALAEIADAGADAVIVQDVGVAQLARRIAPALEVHGSTQMSITSAEGVELARRFGVDRVVLARELSLAEIRTIRSQTDMPLEMFVHGALCVSYSGQCFSSEAWGGRSANRGRCAQACRLPYELLVDDVLAPLPAETRYLLLPGDLYAVHHIPEIVQIGIASLKIEGRYKDADYVALTTRAYRTAVDEAWAGLPLSLTHRDELQLEQVYSRGLGPHFISGTNHQAVVQGRSPGHRGVLMGRVMRIEGGTVWLQPEPSAAAAPLKPGDGVVFDAAGWRSPEEPEEGGRVFELLAGRRGLIGLRFGSGAIDPGRIRVGDLLWRTHDPELDRRVRPILQPGAPLQRQPLSAGVTAHEGRPLVITWRLVAHPDRSVTVTSDLPLGHAEQHPADALLLREQLGRLGDTPYRLEQLELDLAGRPFIPSSLLNQLRREAVARLTKLQEQPPAAALVAPEVALAELTAGPAAAAAAAASAQLHLLVRTAEQLEAAIDVRPASITLDYLELYGLRPAVERVQQAGITARVAAPRVLKPSEQKVVRFLLKLGCAIVVRSGGLLEALQHEAHPPLIGDFSLNAANALAARSYMQLGLERITPTHDLNAAQVAELVGAVGADQLEVVAYQHLPVFHTEHCVFCRFLSTGTSYRDCGHPCERHRVALRDAAGRAHPVMADVGCRNTVFGAEAQVAARHLDAWRRSGIIHYRLEFVHETAADVACIAQLFADALTGRISSAELGRQIQAAAPQGTTEGSLFVPRDYQTIPLL